MRKKIALFVCVCLMITTVAAGCSSSSKKPMTPAKKPSTTNIDTTASERRVMANRLSRIAESVPGVQKATVVVMDVSMTQNTTTTGTTGMTTPNKITTTGKTTTGTKMTPGTTMTPGTKRGIMVMVGLTLNTATGNTAAKATSVKKMVGKRIKASDKRISQVLVTTDPNMIKRLNDIAAGIIQGKPIQSFSKDVKELNAKLKRENAVY